MRLRQLYILMAMVITGLAVQVILASPVYATIYVSQATSTSVNLLTGSPASGITGFHYNIASLPAGSGVKVQFSKDNVNWYSSGGILNALDNLTTTGGADLSLSAFAAAVAWTNGDPFYYRIELTSTADFTATPSVEDIRLDYTPVGAYDAFTLDNYGRIGLGTTTPNSLLQISGATPKLTLSDVFGSVNGKHWFIGNSGGDFSIGTTSDSLLTNSTYLTVKGSTGNLGIGTANPLGKLDISGSDSSTALTTFSGVRSLSLVNTDLTNNNANGLVFRTKDVNGIVTTGAKIMGVYTSHAASQVSGDLAFLTNNLGTVSEKMRILANGNVGIGTSSPLAGLDIAGALGSRSDLFNVSSTTATNVVSSLFRIQANGNIGIGTTSPWGLLSVNANALPAGTPQFVIGSSTATNFIVANNGNVGIGKSNPTVALDVAGLLNVTGSVTSSGNIFAAGGSVFGNNGRSIFASPSDGILLMQNWAQTGFTRLDFGGTTSAFPALAVNGSDLQVIRADGSTNANLLVTGNVGIGTTTPNSLLSLYQTSSDVGMTFGDSLTTNFIFGTDYSASSSLKISAGSALGTNDLITITPAQTSFQTPASFEAAGDVSLAYDLVFNNPTASYIKSAAPIYIEAGENFNSSDLTLRTFNSGNIIMDAGDTGGTIIQASSTAAALTVYQNGSLLSNGPIAAFYASSTEVMRITATATGTPLVAIGTTSPQGLLDISGGSTSTDLTTFVGARALSLINTDLTNNNMSGLDFRTMDTNGLLTTGAKIMGVYTSHAANAITGDLAFVTRNGSTIAERMRLTAAGNLGIGTTSPYAALSVAGLGVFDNLFATSTTATSTFAGGLNVGNGDLTYDYSSGITSINSLSLSAANFDSDMGAITWIDMPLTSGNSSAGSIQSYSASIASNPILTVYAQADGLGNVIATSTAIGIGTTTPLAMLDIFAGSTTPFTTGFMSNYNAVAITNQATSSGANLIKTGLNIQSTGSWNGSAASNIGLYVSSVTGGANNYDAIFNGGGNVGIGTTTPSMKLSVWGAGANGYFGISNALQGDIFTVNSNGNIGIGTTTPYAKLAVGGLGVFDNLFASSTTATSTFAGGLSVGSGALSYEAGSGLTYAGGLTMSGAMNFDTDAGVATWVDMPVSSALSVYGTPVSYTAQMNSNPMLTIYAVADGTGGIVATSTAIGIGTTTPLAMLDIFAGSTTPFTTGRTANYDAVAITNQATSSGANLIKTGLNIQSTGTWNGTGAKNVGLYVSSVTGGTNNYDAIFNGGGNVGIGTTSPFKLLSLQTDTGGEIAIKNTTSGRYTLLGMPDSWNTALDTVGGGNLQLRTQGVARMTFNDTTAIFDVNVGIGTSTPSVKLNVFGGGGNPATTGMVQNGNLRLNWSPTIRNVLDFGNQTASPYGSWLQSTDASDLSVNYPLLLNSNGGNVGIGTMLIPGLAGPAATLHVNTLATSNILTEVARFGVSRATDVATTALIPMITLAGQIPTGKYNAQSPVAMAGIGSFFGGEATNQTTGIAFYNRQMNTGMTDSWLQPMTILGNGNVGIGVTNPDTYKLETAGTFFAGSSDSLGLTINGNTLGVGNPTGASYLGAGNLNLDTYNNAGSSIVFKALTVEKMRMTDAGNLGIGTTSPYAKLSVVGGVVADYFYATSTTATSTFAGGLVANGTSIFDNAEFGGLTFDTDAGAVTWMDMPFSSSATSGTVESYTASLNGSSTLTIYGTANGSGYLLQGPNVGIGTTSPYSKLALVDDTTNLRDVFTISTSTTSGLIFKVDSYGATYADGAYSGAGADYAEYFKTNSSDLKSGEVVCVDILENSAVKRCERGADNNLMGIVSAKPSVIGNYNNEAAANPAGYAVIGMLGQVDALVSAENGPINVGDSLTSASSTPGYAMRADGGDSTVGVALERLASGTGKIKVLISRRNKSLAVEEVEALVVERIANMKIEDRVQQMIKQSVDNLNLDPKIAAIAQEEAGKLDSILSVSINDANGQIGRLADKISNFQFSIFNQFSIINDQINALSQKVNSMASSSALAENIKIDEEGSLVIGRMNLASASATPEVRIIDPTEINASSTQTAFVVNQAGSGEVADFRNNGVSIMNIDNSGQVKIMGSMLVDGRIMLCTGGNCSNALDSAVDATQADLGVEGKVVAGAFEGYCDTGFIWVPGSAKYGTLPGFCVMSDLAYNNANLQMNANAANAIKTGVSQGEAQVACQSLGAGYHLIGENEWLTIAENILQVAANDADKEAAGMQLASAGSAQVASSSASYVLANDNIINNLSGATAEWTNQNITAAGLPKAALTNDWSEYSEVTDYKGLNIAPDYYLTDANNHIGRIYVGSQAGLKGFVRGLNGIYGLDLSHTPDEKSETIGFRCAK